MATEIELKLSLPASAARKLSAHPILRGLPHRRQRLENTYYDTPQLDLLAELVAVRRRKKGGEWLLTVKSAEPASGGLACRSEWERPAHPDDLDLTMVDNAPLRRRLESHATALTPVFTTHFIRTAWQLDFAGARIEVALDRGHIESAGRKAVICEIELELLSGEVSGLFALARALQQDLPLHPSTVSKAERGYALFRDAPLLPCKAKLAALAGDVDALSAFRQMALNCLDQLQRNEAGLRRGDNPEFLHQARVALRRLRSCLKLFAPVLPTDFVRIYGNAWRQFAHSLNEARDWDVFEGETLPALCASFPADAGLQRLSVACRREAQRARRLAAAQFADPAYSRLLLDFGAALQTLPASSAPDLAQLSRERLQRRARQARRLAKRLHELESAERHHLRISFKKLRYTLEFAPPGKGRKAYLKTLARLQEELGRINDQVSAARLLERLLPNARPGLAHGWIAGRQALLAAELPNAIKLWMAQPAPWKYS